jgi:IMP cyclohydrolase
MGRDFSGRYEVAAYAITGRSPSSQARRLKEEGDAVRIEVTDEAQLKKGDPRLLVYDAVRRLEGIIIVSNGAQTDVIHAHAKGLGPSWLGMPTHVLSGAFSKPHEVGGVDVTTYEPDEPNFTPRISGLIAKGAAALWTAMRNGNGLIRCSYEFRLADGKGRAIMTYASDAPSGKPLPSFKERPLEVTLGRGIASPDDMAQALYGALAPKRGKQDYRVAAAAVFLDRETGESRVGIVNRS